MADKFKNVLDVIELFGEEKVKELVNNLERSKSVASGNLSESVRFTVNIFGSTYRFNLLLADYYEWVDKGRKPGKMPPTKNILKWIGQRGLEVSALKGYGKNKAAGKVSIATNLQKTRSLAYLIAKKIGEKGTKGNKFFSKSINRNEVAKLKRRLSEGLKKDVIVEIRQIKKEIKK